MAAHFLQVLWVSSSGSVPDPRWLWIVRAPSLPYKGVMHTGSAVWDTQGFSKRPGHTGRVENPCLPGAGPAQKRAGAPLLGSRLHTETLWQSCVRRPTARSQRAWGSRLPIPCNSYTVSLLFLYWKDYIWLQGFTGFKKILKNWRTGNVCLKVGENAWDLAERNTAVKYLRGNKILGFKSWLIQWKKGINKQQWLKA